MSKFKIILGVLLVPITMYYGYWIVIFSSAISFMMFFRPFLSIFFVLGVFGLLGIIGAWMLLFADYIKAKSLKLLTYIFISLGIISAFIISALFFSIFEIKNTQMEFFHFSLTWGLLLFAVVTFFFSLYKLFPEKKQFLKK